MLQTEDLPRMTSLSPGNDVMDLKSTKLICEVNTKRMKIFSICTEYMDTYFYICTQRVHAYSHTSIYECLHTCPRICLITHELVLTV